MKGSRREIRNMVIRGKRTSLQLETVFWDAASLAAQRRGLTMVQLVHAALDRFHGPGTSMSSSMRMFLIMDAREQLLLAEAAATPETEGAAVLAKPEAPIEKPGRGRRRMFRGRIAGKTVGRSRRRFEMVSNENP